MLIKPNDNKSLKNIFILLIISLPFYSIKISPISMSLKDILIILLLVICFASMINYDIRLTKRQLTLLSLTLTFLLFSIVSLINAPNLMESLRVNFSLLNILFLLFITIRIVRTKAFLVKVMKYIYVISVFMSIVGILQFLIYQFLGIQLGGALGYSFLLQTNFRSTGFFENPNLYNFFLYLGNSISLVCLVFCKKYNLLLLKLRYICINELIFIGAIICSGSKGAFISTLISIALLTVVIFVKKKIFYFLLLFLSIPALYILENIENVVKIIFEDSGEQNARLDYWSYALQMAKEKPLLGYGMDSFRTVSGLNHIPHNLYIQTLSENGLIGLSILLVILFGSALSALKIALKSLMKEDLVISLSLFIALTQMLVHSFSLSSINNVMLWLCISLISTFNFLYSKEKEVKFKYGESNDLSR